MAAEPLRGRSTDRNTNLCGPAHGGDRRGLTGLTRPHGPHPATPLQTCPEAALRPGPHELVEDGQKGPFLFPRKEAKNFLLKKENYQSARARKSPPRSKMAPPPSEDRRESQRRLRESAHAPPACAPHTFPRPFFSWEIPKGQAGRGRTEIAVSLVF